jgi:hypothetical protein
VLTLYSLEFSTPAAIINSKFSRIGTLKRRLKRNKKLYLRNFFSIFFLSILITSCSETITPSKTVYVRQIKDSFEMEVKINLKGQGWSVHNFSWDKYNRNELYWLYLPKISGRVDASLVKISAFRNDSRQLRNEYQGYIYLDSMTMTIKMRHGYPNKNGKLTHLKPCILNGIYQLNFRDN